MGVQTYLKRPVTIEALRWTGDNYGEVQQWCGDHVRQPSPENTIRLFVNANGEWLTLQQGEWIAKDRHGFYPIKDDVFLESYDKVD